MIWFLVLFPLFLCGNEQESRLQALLKLGDFSLAEQEAALALSKYPTSPEIFLQAIKIFAASGAEEEMIAAFRKYQTLSENPWPREALEEMAWGIIEKGSKAHAPELRAIALITASMGNDAKGVDILLKNSGDPHRLIRAVVVEFASHFRDEALQEMIAERLKLEKDVEVRIALLQAVGSMKIRHLEQTLLQVLENERSLAEEKTVAIASLVALKETPDSHEIQKLIQSKKAALRLLAARLIEIQENAHFLIPLLKDAHAEVRKAALETLGALRPKECINFPLHDSSPEVAMTAAWVLMLYDQSAGQALLERWLQSSHPDERLYAACVLKGAGKYGFPLTLKVFKETHDPFVKLNLAMALVQEDHERELGIEAIFHAVMNHNERWMECECGRFTGIGPCNQKHRADIPHYPEALNQMTRLEMLNLLAIHKHPKAQEATLQFLNGRPWGITGAASALLLTEGDEEALKLIRELLKCSSEKVQLQAALILALWGNDSLAMETLERLYFRVPFSKKEQILEALGKIGDSKTIPFLVERLEEPQGSLRMLAAAALLQTLYH